MDAWAASGALLQLAAAFGGHRPSTGLLPWLDEFSAEHWDFRGGQERNLARAASFSSAQVSVIVRHSAELGLAGREVPSASDYDTVIMTGGMVRAGIVKPRQVAALIAGGLRARDVVFLGGVRQFSGDEFGLAGALGIDGHTEFDSMVAGMERAFGPLGQPTVHSGDGQNARSWGSLSVVAAPSVMAGRRANSADTFRFWAAGRPPQRLLIVTTPIYVPYQGAVAAEILGLEYGHSVETVGTTTVANDLGAHTQRFLASHHLQELRSAIRAMISLRAAAVASATGAAPE